MTLSHWASRVLMPTRQALAVLLNVIRLRSDCNCLMTDVAPLAESYVRKRAQSSALMFDRTSSELIFLSIYLRCVVRDTARRSPGWRPSGKPCHWVDALCLSR